MESNNQDPPAAKKSNPAGVVPDLNIDDLVIDLQSFEREFDADRGVVLLGRWDVVDIPLDQTRLACVKTDKIRSEYESSSFRIQNNYPWQHRQQRSLSW